jgi:hypothetical protein
MASFCGSCGAPLGVNSAFCPQCGTPAGNRPNPVASPASPPVSPPYPAPVTQTAKTSSGLKIVIVLLCCLVVGGAAVVGGMLYLAHRVKQAVVEKAAENGVDLSSIGSSQSATHHTLPKVCGILTTADISRLIGEPIDRAELKDAMCMYYGPPGLSAKLAQDQASGTFNRAQVPNAKVDGTEVANSVDQLVNSLGAQAGQTGSGGELPLLMLGLDADGKAQMTAVSASKAIFGSLGKAADGTGGIGFGSDIPGLGDKAIRIPKLGLNVLQGETLIRIIPGPFPDSDARTIAVARAVLPKI